MQSPSAYSPQELYTYRAGERLPLIKLPDQFIIRALPHQLGSLGISDAQQLSSKSSRISCRSQDLESLMAQARCLAPTYHAYEIVRTGEDFLITDRVLVSFETAPSETQLGEFLGQYGLVQKETYSDRDFLLQLTDHTGINPIKLIVLLNESEPLIQTADHDLNYVDEIFSVTLPTDPAYQQQWHLHEQLRHPNFDRRASSNTEKAWHLLGHFGSADVVIGVTDDGCKIDHPDFNSAQKFAGWGYFTETRLVTRGDIDANPAQMFEPGADHGTACAGVVAAEVDATLTVGAAPGCRLLPIKWQSQNGGLFISDSKLLKALNYLADKIDVMSNSWGKIPVGTWSTLVIRRITDLAQTGGRRGKGIIFLWAAGNSNCPIDHLSSIEVPYTNGWEFRPNGSQVWIGVRTTRTYRNNLTEIPGVMHIAAINSVAQRSHYSNYGKGISLCAPSNNVHTYLRLPVKGLGITTTSGMGQLFTDGFGGTSSATPLIAGIAGLVISANPSLTALEVISILKRTASKDLNFEGYPRTPGANYDQRPHWDVSPIAPYGRGEFQENRTDPDGSWSPWFGYGKVDAQAAVAAAQALLPDSPSVDDSATSQHLAYQSTPNLAIPDNNSQGIEDRIAIAESAILHNLEVSVNISHSWIGDLRIQLVSPDGTTVELHNRTGSSQSNLKETYTPLSLPALGNFKNRPIQGEWQLQVRDLAAQDTGNLKSWSLALTTAAGAIMAEETAGVAIPDFDREGIIRTLTLPDTVTIKNFEVFVDISHPNIGDLLVSLVTPQGIPITLHNQTGGGLDNLNRAWSDQDNLNLQALQGKNAGGTWQLRVADQANQNKGKLNHWRLSVKPEV